MNPFKIHFWKHVWSIFKEKEPKDIQCPVCGYYCLGKGGLGCIDKPGMIEARIIE